MTRTLEIKTPRWAVPLLSPARYKGAHGGRGSGKSHVFAELLIEAHVADQARSTVCVREVQRSLRESVKRLLEQKIEALGVSDYFRVQDTVILSTRGPGRIIFAGMHLVTAESIKSLEGYDCAWVEEAQTLSQRSLDLLRPTIRKPGSELWFSWNPSKKTDPVDVLLRGDALPDSAIVVSVNYDQNPWLPAELAAEAAYDQRRDLDKFDHVWQGGYQTASERRVFRNWKIEEFEAPSDAVHRFGADWGFAVDPTVLVRSHMVGRTLYVDYEAWRIGCDIVDTPALFLEVPDSERWPIVADGSRPETISHIRRNGFPKITGAIKGPRSVEEGVEFLKGFDIVVHPRCTHTIDELTQYSYKADPLTGQILPLLEDKKNHVIDALRYACENVRRIVRASTAKLIPLPTASRWS